MSTPPLYPFEKYSDRLPDNFDIDICHELLNLVRRASKTKESEEWINKDGKEHRILDVNGLFWGAWRMVSKNSMIIAFRGTQTVDDWNANRKYYFTKKRCKLAEPTAHPKIGGIAIKGKKDTIVYVLRIMVFSAKVLGFKEEKQTVSCVVDPDWTTLEVRIEFMATMYAMLDGGVGHEKLKEHGGMFHLMSAATMENSKTVTAEEGEMSITKYDLDDVSSLKSSLFDVSDPSRNIFSLVPTEMVEDLEWSKIENRGKEMIKERDEGTRSYEFPPELGTPKRNNDDSLYQGMFNYKPYNQYELKFHIGEMFEVVDSSHPVWYAVRNVDYGDEGYIPKELLYIAETGGDDVDDTDTAVTDSSGNNSESEEELEFVSQETGDDDLMMHALQRDRSQFFDPFSQSSTSLPPPAYQYQKKAEEGKEKEVKGDEEDKKRGTTPPPTSTTPPPTSTPSYPSYPSYSGAPPSYPSYPSYSGAPPSYPPSSYPPPSYPNSSSSSFSGAPPSYPPSSYPPPSYPSSSSFSGAPPSYPPSPYPPPSYPNSSFSGAPPSYPPSSYPPSYSSAPPPYSSPSAPKKEDGDKEKKEDEKKEDEKKEEKKDGEKDGEEQKDEEKKDGDKRDEEKKGGEEEKKEGTTTPPPSSYPPSSYPPSSYPPSSYPPSSYPPSSYPPSSYPPSSYPPPSSSSAYPPYQPPPSYPSYPPSSSSSAYPPYQPPPSYPSYPPPTSSPTSSPASSPASPASASLPVSQSTPPPKHQRGSGIGVRRGPGEVRGVHASAPAFGAPPPSSFSSTPLSSTTSTPSRNVELVHHLYRVHYGFYDTYQMVVRPNDKDGFIATIRDILDRIPDLQIYVAGFSLGGAIATYLAFEAWVALGQIRHKPNLPLLKMPYLYTFGTPRPGDRSFQKLFNYHFHRSGHAFRVLLDLDPVPTVPPQSQYYRHVGCKMLMKVDQGRRQSVARAVSDQVNRSTGFAKYHKVGFYVKMFGWAQEELWNYTSLFDETKQTLTLRFSKAAKDELIDTKNASLYMLCSYMAHPKHGVGRTEMSMEGKKFQGVFVGEDACGWIEDRLKVESRKHTIDIGNQMISKKYFRHPIDPNKIFTEKDKYVFYGNFDDSAEDQEDLSMWGAIDAKMLDSEPDVQRQLDLMKKRRRKKKKNANRRLGGAAAVGAVAGGVMGAVLGPPGIVAGAAAGAVIAGGAASLFNKQKRKKGAVDSKEKKRKEKAGKEDKEAEKKSQAELREKEKAEKKSQAELKEKERKEKKEKKEKEKKAKKDKKGKVEADGED